MTNERNMHHFHLELTPAQYQLLTTQAKQCGLSKRAYIVRLLEGNIDQSYYGRIETGKRGCPVDLLIQLSDLFGVSLDYLVLGKSGNGASESTAVTQLKSDIEDLIGQLELFKTSL